MYFTTGHQHPAKIIEILTNKLLNLQGEYLESKRFIFFLHTTYIFMKDFPAPGEASNPPGRTSRSKNINLKLSKSSYSICLGDRIPQEGWNSAQAPRHSIRPVRRFRQAFQHHVLDELHK